jgi:hypothetical protein
MFSTWKFTVGFEAFNTSLPTLEHINPRIIGKVFASVGKALDPATSHRNPGGQYLAAKNDELIKVHVTQGFK